MPLHSLLFRCPECGHDPTDADETGVRCQACGTRFSRGKNSSIVIQSPDGPERIGVAAALVDALGDWETKAPTGVGSDGSLNYSASVSSRRGIRKGVAYEGKAVLGFFEEFAESVPGTLRITDLGMSLAGPGHPQFEWGWENLGAVQTSSRSLQLKWKTDGLFEVRFDADSPRRWAGLVHRGLQAHFGGLGMQVREFHPRIVTVVVG